MIAEEPEKLDLRSHDIAADKRHELLRLFPEVRTEAGMIDFDRLKLALGEAVDVGKERYGMTWPGKADCFKAIQTPSMGTLLPRPDESVNWDTTENLIIEGDNLEVLKLLQKSYLGKVKMIYIDPPYNTGNDFIYPDNFSESLQTYLEYSGQVDSEGKKFSTNSDTDGRFHSKWLNMMYPRLYLARNLLREDGAIFISIDDGELDNLRKLCAEILGEENFVAQILWRKRSTPPNDQIIGANHDYVLVYARNVQTVKLHARPRSEGQVERYKNPDNHPKGPWAAGDLTANVKGGRYTPVLNFAVVNPNTGVEHFPGTNGNWRFNKEKIQRLLDNNEIYFGVAGTSSPKLKRFFSDVKEGVTWPTIWDFTPLNNQGSQEMTQFFGDSATFENPKPSGLVAELLRLGSASDDIVLDFFAGSGTTAHSCLSLNEEDGGRRRFVLVQLPEPTGRDDFPTIADLCAERVRRVIKTLDDDRAAKLNLETQVKDRAFRLFELAESNFAAWESNVAEDSQTLTQQLELHIDPVRDDRKPLDVLFEILLKNGFPLTAPMEVLTVSGKQVYSVAAGGLLICLEPDLTLEALRAMAELGPERVTCLDEGFAKNDQLKANAVQIFKAKGIVFRTV